MRGIETKIQNIHEELWVDFCLVLEFQRLFG